MITQGFNYKLRDLINEIKYRARSLETYHTYTSQHNVFAIFLEQREHRSASPRWKMAKEHLGNPLSSRHNSPDGLWRGTRAGIYPSWTLLPSARGRCQNFWRVRRAAAAAASWEKPLSEIRLGFFSSPRKEKRKQQPSQHRVLSLTRIGPDPARSCFRRACEYRDEIAPARRPNSFFRAFSLSKGQWQRKWGGGGIRFNCTILVC